MTFGAMAAWQAWLLVSAAAALAWWLFRLKIRPPRRAVPSLLLWRHVVDRPADRSWWDRIRRAVSLAATVVIALALALAVTRPGPRSATGSRGRLLIVLDSSWSMRARTPEGDTRWERAVAGARALALSAGSDVAIGTTADGLVEGPSSDTALISTAFDRLEPAGGEGQAWPRVDGVDATHFFTDGALLRPLDPAVVVHSVFRPAPNVAITAFGARPATSSASTASAYLEVANYATTLQRTHVTVTRGASVIADRWIDLTPAEVSQQVIPLDATGGATLRARVSAAGNALDIDDEAVAWLANGDPISVTVVSNEPDDLSGLFAHDPAIHATFVRASEYKPSSADVLVFDRWAPPEAPNRPALYLAPPAVPWLAKAGRDEVLPQWSATESHPILSGVDPFALDISRSRRYEGPALKPIARSAQGTPLVSVLDAPGLRGVLVGFSTADSNLTNVPAFPILVGNALDWLARPAAGEVRTPGPLELPASTTRVTAPDGQTVRLVPAGDRVLVRLRTPGLYLVEAGGSESVVGVNVGNPAIGNLSRTNLPPDARSAALAAFAGGAWWIYGVVLALVLLLTEWWTWQRKITV
jgi:hypothetical protein